MPHAGESDGSRESVPCDVSITATSGTPSGGIAPRLSTKKRSYTLIDRKRRLQSRQNDAAKTQLLENRRLNATHDDDEGPAMSGSKQIAAHPQLSQPDQAMQRGDHPGGEEEGTNCCERSDRQPNRREAA